MSTRSLNDCTVDVEPPNTSLYSSLLESPKPKPTKSTCLQYCQTKRCVKHFTIITLCTFLFLLTFYYLLLPIIITDILRTTSIKFEGVGMDDHLHPMPTPSNLPLQSYLTSFPNSADLNQELLGSAEPTPKRNSVLTLTAQCKIEGMTLPFDIGIVTSSLNVFHEQSRLGHLVPLHPEVTVYKKDHGNFSLIAGLHVDNMTSFHEFAGHLLEDDTVTWRIADVNGVSIRLHVPFFGTALDLYVPRVHLNKTVVMKGMSKNEKV